MYVTAQESRALSHLFGLLAEDLAEREVRERIGHHLLELLSADYYATHPSSGTRPRAASAAASG
jgi:hypothetical protein